MYGAYVACKMTLYGYSKVIAVCSVTSVALRVLPIRRSKWKDVEQVQYECGYYEGDG